MVVRNNFILITLSKSFSVKFWNPLKDSQNLFELRLKIHYTNICLGPSTNTHITSLKRDEIYYWHYDNGTYL
jgi:hypothetical protein